MAFGLWVVSRPLPINQRRLSPWAFANRSARLSNFCSIKRIVILLQHRWIKRIFIHATADFRWSDWNLAHATKHCVSVEEAESVVRRASRPYPQDRGRGKWIVVGRGQGDRVVEVVYLIDRDERLYIIHAMPLSTRRRRRSR